ncbi:MAG: hypothetical protein NVS1B4_22250 [Gemmatimonadaceae bacterium]
MASGLRHGYSLIETLIAIVIFAIIGATLISLVRGQHHFYRAVTELIGVRTELREATDVASLELRGVASAAGDIYALTDSSIDFRMVTGNSVVCAIMPGNVVVLPARKLIARNWLTVWATTPVAGDSAFFHNDGPTASMTDDVWDVGGIQSVGTAAAGDCPTTTGFVQAADAPGVALTMTVPLSPNVNIGDPVRLFRHAKYQIYKSTNGLWYLGFSDCLAPRTPVCTNLEPMSGPFRAYSATSPNLSGLRFVAYDSSGAVTALSTKAARIDLVLQAESKQMIDTPGLASGTYRDSLLVSIAIRNRTL